MATKSTEKICAFEVLVAEDEGAVRDIVIWLLRSAGYRALAAADPAVIRSLFVRQYPLLVVSTLPTVFPEGLDMLAFHNMLHPHIPVLIARGSALGRWPEVERWARGLPRKPCGAASFQTRLERLASQATILHKSGQQNPVYGRSIDQKCYTNGNAVNRPLSLPRSHAPSLC